MKMLIALAVVFCAGFATQAAAAADPTRLAAQVVIHRDEWGVPHIVGESDPATIFGLGYAQAEDNFAQVETNIMAALGRSAELRGEDELQYDLLVRAHESPQRARLEYDMLSSELRALCEAYAAGINYYLEKHPEVRPRVLTRFEPWHPIAILRAAFSLSSLIATGIDEQALRYPDIRAGEGVTRGSNGWAIGPSRTASGNAMLFLNPHSGLFGFETQYEVHVLSRSGWNFSGQTFLGGMMPDMGFNAALGWTPTINRTDVGDLYVEQFDDPARPKAYRYGEGWREANEWTETIGVKAGDGIERRTIRFRKTHHGPIVDAGDGRTVSLRMARTELGSGADLVRQLHAMNRAADLDEFKAALAICAIPYHNFVYADKARNFYYIHYGAVPRRDPRFDWSKPVDGADPATEWQGYHAIDELPQLLNPPTGWVQNTNSSPYTTLDRGNLDPANYPDYMASEGDNERARQSRRLLSVTNNLTLDGLEALAFDRRVGEADNELTKLFADWGEASVAAPASLGEPIEVLRSWDRLSHADSVAMTLFARYHARLYDNYRTSHDFYFFPVDRKVIEPGTRLKILAETIADLEAKWGSWRIPYGEMYRLQRPDAAGEKPFSDDEPSLPFVGVNGSMGAIFMMVSRQGPKMKRRYGVLGHSYVGAVEFTKKGPVAKTVLAFGQSADPKSPHYFDQAHLMAAGKMKRVWFSLSDVKAHSKRRYHPGE